MEHREDALILEGFTKLPPAGEIEADKLKSLSAYVTEMDLSEEQIIDVLIPILSRRSKFEETENGVYALEAFLLASHGGFYPPSWVIEWLDHAIQDYHASNGIKDIGVLLGLKSPGKGHRHPFAGVLAKDVEEDAMYEIWKLKTMFPTLSTGDAADMVSQWVRAGSWNQSDHNLTAYEGTTLEHRYDGKWSRIFENLNKSSTVMLQSRSADDKQKYLEKFPVNHVR
jgi:hypothetical protein